MNIVGLVQKSECIACQSMLQQYGRHKESISFALV